ncbi:hypothetical protein B0H13DRAFT_2332996 [Mycena leptocephala]|nr:hypothetical protein B0H13DRAFT_2332996 [Mycena leptocephala]
MGDAARCDPEMGAGGQRDLEIGEIYIPHDIAKIVARIWKARGAGRVGGDVVRVCGFLSFVCLHPAFSACDSYLLYASTSLCLHALPPPCLDLATPSLSLVSQRLISLCSITNPLALSRTKITDRSPSSARAAADAVNACDRDVFTAGLAALSRDGPLPADSPPFRRSSHTLTRIPFDTTNPPPQRLSAGLCDTHAPHASSNYGWTQPPPVDVTAPNATIQHFQIQSYTRPLEIVVVTIRFRALGLRSWPARLPSRPSTENCASRHSRCPRRYEPASARIRWLGTPYTPEFCSCRAPRREFYRVKALSLGIRDARAANALTHCRVSMPVRPPTALWRVPDYVPSYTAMRAGREMACAFPHSPLCLRARAAMQRFARPRKQEAAQSPTLRSGSRKARAPRSQLALGAHAAEEWRNRLSNEK